MVDFVGGKLVGKYTVRPMNPIGCIYLASLTSNLSPTIFLSVTVFEIGSLPYLRP